MWFTWVSSINPGHHWAVRPVHEIVGLCHQRLLHHLPARYKNSFVSSQTDAEHIPINISELWMQRTRGHLWSAWLWMHTCRTMMQEKCALHSHHLTFKNVIKIYSHLNLLNFTMDVKVFLNKCHGDVTYLGQVNMRLLRIDAEDVPQNRKGWWSWWEMRRISLLYQTYQQKNSKNEEQRPTETTPLAPDIQPHRDRRRAAQERHQITADNFISHGSLQLLDGEVWK